MTGVIFGAAGYGLGGAVAGSLHLDPGNPANPLNMGIMGAIGGVALGLALRNWKKAGLLVIMSGVGLTVGSLPAAMMIAFGLPQVKGDVYVGPIMVAAIVLTFYGAILGLVGVASLLIALRGQHRVRSRPIIIAGIPGFAIAAQAAWSWALGLSIEFTLAIWGAAGGATMGGALGYYQSSQLQRE
jgi:hypothetical protein